MAEYEPVRFVYSTEITHNEILERIVDRALLLLVVSLKTGHMTRGGVQKDKTAKQRQIDRAELDAMLRMMVNDLHIRSDEGTTEIALRFALLDLGVDRGLLIKDGNEYRAVDNYGQVSLFTVMSDARRAREWPQRFMASASTQAKYGIGGKS